VALRTLGSTTTTRLPCLPAWAANLLAADVASIGQAVLLDSEVAAILGGYGRGPTAVLATGTTAASTAVTTLAFVSGAPLSQIRVGDLVLGDGIVPGTFVSVYGGSTTATLSKAATAGGAGTRLIFARPDPAAPNISLNDASLYIPQRGVLKVLPGDIVAVDNTGWPILVSGASIGYAGTDWTLT